MSGDAARSRCACCSAVATDTCPCVSTRELLENSTPSNCCRSRKNASSSAISRPGLFFSGKQRIKGTRSQFNNGPQVKHSDIASAANANKRLPPRFESCLSTRPALIHSPTESENRVSLTLSIPQRMAAHVDGLSLPNEVISPVRVIPTRTCALFVKLAAPSFGSSMLPLTALPSLRRGAREPARQVTGSRPCRDLAHATIRAYPARQAPPVPRTSYAVMRGSPARSA